jgi:BlaI family transcriptional regulator, penicillinase repressor
MAKKVDRLPELSRRERQIMDVLLAAGEASAEEVRSRLPDPPSNSAVRAMLVRLEEKGHATHVEKGLRYVYRPAISRQEAQRSAVSRLVRVFFDGSAAQAVSGLLGQSADQLDDAELDELAAAIEAARRSRGGRS